MTKADEKRLAELCMLMNGLRPPERELITRAYVFAKKAHHGQKRLSGNAYFLHVYKTALTLAELGMDAPTVAAGLLHDTVEDGQATEAELREMFGSEITFLVLGVTKLGRLKYQGLQRHVESLRKLFLAIADDIRVLVIKLADRLHNIKTIRFLPSEKQRRIALETLEIYAPLAHRLGINDLKGTLEDHAFPIVYPEAYRETVRLLDKKSTEYLARLKKIARRIKRKMGDARIRIVKTDHRVKHLYSLYQKLLKSGGNVGKIYDIAALRIIVSSAEDCYKVLGIIHELYRPLPGRVKDYIATPKSNGYRSLHTTVFAGDGGMVEIQIRTPEMHREAEYGAASHVGYKEGTSEHQVLLARLAALPESATPQEFLKDLKADFLNERVFVFTPKGEVIDLPTGATPIDFAYAVHTDVGNHIASATVNNKIAALDTTLVNGDIVHIETRTGAKPTRKWLESAATTFAKRKIRAELQKNTR